MDLQNYLGNKHVVKASIFVGETFPLRIGYRLAELFARFLTKFENSDLSRAIRANQWVAQGENLNHKELVSATRAVLTHAGTCYFDLYHTWRDPEALLERVPTSRSIEDFIEFTNRDEGVLVVAPHLSNFDLVIRALASYGFKAKILTLENPTSGNEVQNRLRATTGLDITPLNDPQVYEKVIKHLKSGGVAATGVDRPPQPVRKKRHPVNFLGRPSALPVGYIRMALAADVPIVVVAVKQLPTKDYTLLYSGPITLKRFDNRLEETIYNAEMILEHIGGYILQAPEQWLMYYPVWPDVMDLVP
ncbi:MAG: lysophospholipid acyltransferase family protein [Anaerolineales bacterium]|nr:lysophospholipid acyltransferase family protein [Anaerolineales bacterium]